MIVSASNENQFREVGGYWQHRGVEFGRCALDRYGGRLH